MDPKRGNSSNNSEFSFVTISHPKEALSGSKRRLVRSHAARHEYSKVDKKDGRRRRRHKTRSFLFEPVEIGSSQDTKNELESLSQIHRDLIADGVFFSHCIIGGTRGDPFRSYPVPWDPFLPFIVDHYLIAMAVDIPVLDQTGHHGLLRTKWFPLTMQDAASFSVIILLAASHYSSIRGSFQHPSYLLNLKQKAIRAINAALKDDDGAYADGTIGAVAKLASYEAMFGDQAAYNIHMSALTRMVRLRGGLPSLGLDGLLARICLWIDFNASYLHNIPLHFVEATPIPIELSELLDPGHFLGFNGL